MSDTDDLLTYYLDWTGTALKDMNALIDRTEGLTAPQPQLVDDIHAIAHNIKGMGTSFNFPLMTKVGKSLCDYLRALTDQDIVSHAVLMAHSKIMTVVLDNQITGDGGDVGQQLLDKLAMMIDDIQG